ncbi:MAG TPA: hypothetical protein VD996_13500 [Chitinophagaceae bacterium]|nr:hypothetical protein [Chitinophagaceae bacterium]
MAYYFAFGGNALPVRNLKKTQWDFRSKMIEGSIAENLVQQLFLTHKYNVSRYTKVHAPQSQMPRFVIHHRLSKETYFVEVRFRADGCFSEKDLCNCQYEDALVIVVSKHSMKCLSVRELKKGWQITPDCSNLLADRSEFELRRDVVNEFCQFAGAFFDIPSALYTVS